MASQPLTGQRVFKKHIATKPVRKSILINVFLGPLSLRVLKVARYKCSSTATVTELPACLPAGVSKE